MSLEDFLFECKNSIPHEDKVTYLSKLKMMKYRLGMAEEYEISEIKKKFNERKQLLDQEIDKREAIILLERSYSVTLGKIKPNS